MIRKIKVDISPMVLALVLASMLESTFRQSLFMSEGDLMIFFRRPISAAFMILLLVILLLPAIRQLVKNRRPPAPPALP